jgi:hypothetical protein
VLKECLPPKCTASLSEHRRGVLIGRRRNTQ